MIWYFLGGMIAGAVGIVMLGKWLTDNNEQNEDNIDKRS